MNIQRYFSTVDAHIGGEPLRVILGGFPPILGHTMEERLRYFERHLDSIRKVLLQEPRGHGGMQACLITAPEKPSSHFGLLTMNAYGYAFRGLSAMAAAAVSLETGLIPLRGETVEVAIDTPRETVTVTAVAEGTGRSGLCIGQMEMPRRIGSGGGSGHRRMRGTICHCGQPSPAS
jgi:proline racemase